MVFGNLLAIFTLDGQIVWMDKSSCICLSDVNLCRTVVDLFVSTQNRLGKIIFPDSQISDNLFVKNLFISFAHQTICSSEMICLSTRFICPLV